MHEEVLFRDLRRKLEEIAREERVTEISRVSVWVGALSHVSEETLRSRWPMTVEGTAARSSRLEVQISTDVNDPRAAGIVLTHVDVVDPVDETDADGAGLRRPHDRPRPYR
ncbi:MAG: hydrogenase/urease maturation nickel metallochaperone HypA [Thermoplasmata archaeon]